MPHGARAAVRARVRAAARMRAGRLPAPRPGPKPGLRTSLVRQARGWRLCHAALGEPPARAVRTTVGARPCAHGPRMRGREAFNRARARIQP